MISNIGAKLGFKNISGQITMLNNGIVRTQQVSNIYVDKEAKVIKIPEYKDIKPATIIKNSTNGQLYLVTRNEGYRKFGIPLTTAKPVVLSESSNFVQTHKLTVEGAPESEFPGRN